MDAARVDQRLPGFCGGIMFDIEDYKYDLPEELIAQEPAPEREESRLFFVDRKTDLFSDHRFLDLPGLLRAGDLLVVNDTRVVPARLYGRKETGGRVELLVLDHPEGGRAPASRRCLMKASKRARVGDRIDLEGGVSGAVEAVETDGIVRVLFSDPDGLDALMGEQGAMPLPPYIKRRPCDPRAELDRDRYQTVYAGRPGAVAAPTAGLHFSERLLERLSGAGVSIAGLTLHVGHGSFRPVRSRDIREHVLGEEAYRIEPETAAEVNRARAEGR
ncbi:MAG: S-adenosylmethionine:tRNA ribosyltransferase-isomerase, partial [Deltaproteobacteria bacterium]|nr:S-adenosylmethionine:tRNA ribosyltransferase-isomerase [Deltaproteobacteria bacterium]